MKRLRQSGSADQECLLQLESEVGSLKGSLDEHKKHSEKFRTSYNETVDKCKSDWKKICELDTERIIKTKTFRC